MRSEQNELSIIHPVCCGIDVHKEMLVACVLKQTEKGNISEIKEFRTFSKDLKELLSWLKGHSCPVVSMESTGVYWRPVHNVLEGEVEVILINARHYKNVPGKKTDISDSKWIANLLQHGLLKGSYIPPSHQREWRELCRARKKTVKTIADYKRRTHKVLETANIKIDSVASDLFCKTGKKLMDYLCEEKKLTQEGVDQCCFGSLRSKSSELWEAINGFFTDHTRYLLQLNRKIVEFLEAEKLNLTKRIESLMEDHSELIEKLIQIPGIQKESAQSILGEIGETLDNFKNADVLCSWAGVCPGNKESAGKRYSGRSPVRKHVLKEILIECSWAAVKKKKSFYRAKYYRLKAKRGAKKAIVAIAHKLLKAIYSIIKTKTEYIELGENYLPNIQKKSLKILKKQALSLGYELKKIAV